MSQRDQEIWDKRYSEGAYAERQHPSPLLSRWLPRPTSGQQALDLACGSGRNTLFLAEAGYIVDAMDISSIGLARAADLAKARHGVDTTHLSINWKQVDLEEVQLPEQHYDLIILMRYVNEELIRSVHRALKPQGYFLCEEHLALAPNRLREAVTLSGPSNPDFRVSPGDLIEWSRDLRCLKSSEGLSTEPDGRCAALAQILAQKIPQPESEPAPGTA